MNNKLTLNAILILFASFFASCAAIDSSLNTTNTVIGHFGYDFSLNSSDTTAPGYVDDGWSNAWGCGGAVAPTTAGVFWCPNPTNTSEKFKDMGAVAFSSVTGLPATWDSPIEAVQVGHVYIAETADGYVVFKVTAIDTTTWDMTVDFLYSATGTFP